MNATDAKIVLQCATSQIHDCNFSLDFIQIHIFFPLDTNAQQLQKLFSIPRQQQIHSQHQFAIVLTSVHSPTTDPTQIPFTYTDYQPTE